MKKLLVVSLVLYSSVITGLLWNELTAHAACGGAIPKGNGDVNGDGVIDISDGIYILSWLFADGQAPVPIDCSPAIHFPDYVPLTPEEYGVKTLLCTHSLKSPENPDFPEIGTPIIMQIVGDFPVPFTSGTLVGKRISECFDWGMDGILFNDGNVVRYLGAIIDDRQIFLSADDSLMAPSESWSFGNLFPGQIIDQVCFPYFSIDVAADLAKLENTQKIVVDLQDVTVPMGKFSKCVVMWTLDFNENFTALNFGIRGESLGIHLPECLPRAVTGFEILAKDIGHIAKGDVEALNGDLNYIFELTEMEK